MPRNPLGEGADGWLTDVAPLPGEQPQTVPQPRRQRKEKLTIDLPVELADRIRNTVYWLNGPPQRLTLARLFEEALSVRVRELEEAHNDGQPFETRPEQLKGGRPLGS